MKPLDTRDPAFVADPYPIFASLRERDPVHRSAMGFWVLTRYEDVAAALQDPRLSSAPAPYAVIHARNRERYVAADVAHRILPFLDPPAHGRPRRLVSRAFHRHLRAHPLPLEEMAEARLDALEGRDRIDVLADFATPLSLEAMSRLLGVPARDAEQLGRWADSFFYLFAAIPSREVLARVDRDLAAFRAYLESTIAKRAREPRHDLISALAEAEEDDERLDPQALVDHCMLVFADGIENVDRAIASGVASLLAHPEELERLRADPSLSAVAAEELLRYESPAQLIGRVAVEELVVHGQTVRAGQVVVLALGAANRDPARFDDPDRLDVGRSDNPHLAFGRGAHACIGGALVRRELEAAIGALLRRAPALRRADDGPLAWTPRAGHRWLARLDVALG